MDSHDQQKQADRRVKRFVTISFALHIALFLSFGIGSLFAPKTLVIAPAVQIDMVALPNQLKGEEPPEVDLTKEARPNVNEPPPNVEAKVENPPEPEPEPKVSEPDPDAMALEREKKEKDKKRKEELDAKKRAAEALKKMKAEAEKERQEEERRRQEALAKRKKDLEDFNKKYREALRGNQKNEGNSATGEVGQAVMNAYQGHLLDRLRRNWALPQFLQGKGYRAVMRIYLDARGNVVGKTFTRTSGNNMFDNYVESAVDQSSPFAPPPAEMASGLRSGGVEIQFPL